MTVQKASEVPGPPTVTAYTPANGAQVSVNTDKLVLKFNETVWGVTNKFVDLCHYTGASIIRFNAAYVNGQGTDTITIPLPPGTLSSNFGYCVKIDAAAFVDSSGENYAGISDSTTWTFTTANDTTPPTWTENYPKIIPVSIEQERFQIFGSISEAGIAYYVVLNDGADEPTASQVKNGYNSSNQLLADNLRGSMVFSGGNSEETIWVAGLTPNTAYDVYIVAEDIAGNLQSAPVKLQATTKAASTSGRWQKVRAGDSTTIALDTSGSLWGWGNNSVGQIGDGTKQTKYIPTPLNQGNQWATVVSGDHHTLALKSDKTLWTWGFNDFGQIGKGNEFEQLSPIQIGTDRWICIAAGYKASAGIKENGTLWIWGRNNGGKLGLGDDTDTAVLTPTQVGTDSDWSSVSVGTGHCLAIKNNGTLWAWGHDGWGKLGNGDISSDPVLTPQQIGSNTNWRLVSASKGVGSGGNFSLGLKTNGTLWAWGCNEYGILGVSGSTKSYSSTPMQVSVDTDWQLAETGSDHILALKNNGTLWAWGNNYSGQLGTLPIGEQRYTITQVNNDTDWSSLAAGARASYAIKSNGTMWSWGQNTVGELGDGTTDNHILPAEIGQQTLSDTEAVAADTAALTWDTTKGANSTENNVTANLINPLPTTGSNGTTITWSASPTGWINTTTGAVTRPTSAQGDQTVILTAAISKGSASAAKDFTLTIKAASAEQTPDEAISLDLTALTWNTIKGTNSSASSITSSLNLISSGDNGTNISWSANPAGLINTSTGAVTRPTSSQGNKTVTLTAVISKAGGTSKTKTFTLTIAALSSSSSGGSGGGGTTPTGILVTSSGKTASVNEVTVTFPGGAVENDIRVQIKEIDLSTGMSLPDDGKLLSQIIDIVKDKSSNFKKSVTITLSFNKSMFNPDEYDIAIYYYDEDTGKWIALDNIRLNLEAGSISGDTTHFTKFAVIATPKAIKEEKPVKPVTPQPIKNIPGDISGHWAKDSILKLTNAGVVSGYPDGTFKPNNTVTRAEFTVMLVKALNLETRVGKTFNDTNSHWAKDSISTAAAHGIISGYDENTFGPDDLITREQVAVIIARAAQLETGTDELTFTDSKAISSWAKPGVAAAFKGKFITGYPDHSFRAQGKTTRAEAAVIIGKLLK